MSDFLGMEDEIAAEEQRKYKSGTPPMPEGFTDKTAWDAIHFRFSGKGTLLDQAVISWQKNNQDRVKAAMEAESKK